MYDPTGHISQALDRKKRPIRGTRRGGSTCLCHAFKGEGVGLVTMKHHLLGAYGLRIMGQVKG